MTADVTVVMPAMNRAHLIERALESVRRQTLAPRRVVVIDDASDDGTADVARHAGAEVLEMPRRSGSGPARNAGISSADTEWIAFLDSDDEWLPHHLQTVLGLAQGHVLASTAATSTSGRWLGSPRPSPEPVTPRRVLVPSDLVVTSATVVRRDALEAVGLFRPLPRAQDMDAWIRVLELGTGVVAGEATVFYHEHDTQAVRDVGMMRSAFERIIEDHSQKSWMDQALRDGALARVVWDDLRAAQRSSRWRDAAGSAWWLVRRPAAVGAVGSVLAQRRRARRRAARAAG
ncbi:glycosyltransferase family 2 protein [Pseudokineococcus sp. 5B2Z-1]|uniref:glycosyltransferase family 2 protein n=1 Tax=Pseudokineococcus sp. 5B2Z-1 TaxID=3132744 RepID=UPI00309FDEBE